MANVKLYPTDKRVTPVDIVKQVQEWIGGQYKYLFAEPTASFTLATYSDKVDLREYWLYAKELNLQYFWSKGVVILHGDDLFGNTKHVIQAIVVRAGADGLIGFGEFVQAGFPKLEYYDQLDLLVPDRADRKAPLHVCELLSRLKIIGAKRCEHCGKI